MSVSVFLWSPAVLDAERSFVSVFFFSEKELRLIAQAFGILAADKHHTVRARIPRRNSLTLHPSAHSLCFGCTDVRTPFTGYEPKARSNGSTQWSD